MAIWVDADACPNSIKEILFRAAQNRDVELVLVANQGIRTPPSKRIRTVRVPQGFDVADDYIVAGVEKGDLVVTADIPLASEVLAKGADVLQPRGEALDKHNIGQRLNMRDFMDTLRSSGTHTGGPPPLTGRDKQAFGNALDRWITHNR